MTDHARKDQTKDLPPKKVTKGDENVKGGAEPVGGRRPKPAEPVGEL